MVMIEIKHDSDATPSREEFDRCARLALGRVLEESKAPLATVAGAMGYTENHLRMLLAEARWASQAVASLAAASGQHPARMLAREALP